MTASSLEGELSLFGIIADGDCKSDFDHYGGFLLFALLMLYTFKVLATLCDGHLTSVLETMVGRFGISEDVAGATLLAISSSAPELFNAIVSTFVIVSSSGVSNIVGSALFNLLCIIGILPICSKTGPLKIWWYPTMRDAFFYALAVGELYLVIADGKVVLWEAFLMVASYGLYVAYFTVNERILRYFGWSQRRVAAGGAGPVGDMSPAPKRVGAQCEPDRGSEADNAAGDGEKGQSTDTAGTELETRQTDATKCTIVAVAPAPTDGWEPERSLHTVDSLKLAPKLHEFVAAYRQKFKTWKLAFDATDTDGNGRIEIQELMAMLNALTLKLDVSVVTDIFRACDLNENGNIQPHEFASVLWDGGLPISAFAVGWKSTAIILHKLNEAVTAYRKKFKTCQLAFEATDAAGSGSISLQQLTAMLRSLELTFEGRFMEEIFRICDFNKDGKIQPHEFESVLWEGRLAEGSRSTAAVVQKLNEVAVAYHARFRTWQHAFEATDTDRNGCIDVAELATTVASMNIRLEDRLVKDIFHTCDVSRGGGIQPHQFASVLWEGRLLISTFSERADIDGGGGETPGLCTRLDPSVALIDLTMPAHEYILVAFVVVVFWVAFYTYIMVDAAHRLGCFLEVPATVMGLIVLAAGTSVPDMIASISVAKAGFADMAAANAVGSNTFDILLGLGLPWLLRCADGTEIEVPVTELRESIVILVAALIAYVVLIHIKGYVLDAYVGGFMLLVYIAAITYILVRHYTHFHDQ